MRRIFAIALAMVSAGALATDVQAQRRGGGNWENLGCQQVSFIGKDRDSIRVGNARAGSRLFDWKRATTTSRCLTSR